MYPQISIPPLNARIEFLDGLRCLAVGLVVCYHYFSSLPSHYEHLSYGEYYSDFFFAKYGELGVQLFFVVSGFVITQSLHASNDLGDFALRRFARLWPAMALCSSITFAFSFVDPYTYQANALNFLPSLTFLEPKIFAFLLKNEEIAWMDGAYWTLFAEVRFYALAAIIYFTSKEKFFRNFVIFLITNCTIYLLSLGLQLATLRAGLYFTIIPNSLPWFAIGIGFYYLYKMQNTKATILFVISLSALMLNVAAAKNTRYAGFHGVRDLVAIAIVFPTVWVSFNVAAVQRVLGIKLFGAIGVSSYSLYLLHQNVGQKLILMVGNPLNLGRPASGVYAVLIFILVAIFAYLLHRLYEGPMNKLFVKSFSRNRILRPNNSQAIRT